MIDIPAFMEHSGAVLVVVVFLATSIGVTLMLTTVSREVEDQGPAGAEGKEER